jgi:hypothetical protein
MESRIENGVGPTPQEVLDAKRLIVETASRIEAGTVDLFAGCRRMAELRLGLDNATIGDSDMAVFVAIDSELDAYPFGPSREHWAPDILAERDARRDAYLERVRDTMLTACRAVRLKWSTTG